MKKKIAKFLIEASTTRLISWVYSALFLYIFLLLALLEFLFSSTFPPIKTALISALSAIPFTALAVLVVDTFKKSQIFWREAKKVRNSLEEAHTIEDLDDIKNKLISLYGLSLGGVHDREMKVLTEIYKTRHELFSSVHLWI